MQLFVRAAAGTSEYAGSVASACSSAHPQESRQRREILAAAQIEQYRKGSRVCNEEAKCPMLNVMDESRRTGKLIEQRVLYQSRDQQSFNRENPKDDEKAREQAKSLLCDRQCSGCWRAHAASLACRAQGRALLLEYGDKGLTRKNLMQKLSVIAVLTAKPWGW